MLEMAKDRVPEALKSRIQFCQYDPYPLIPLSDAHVDMVFSKGVLTHVEDKVPLFLECYRVLVPSGYLVIEEAVEGYRSIAQEIQL